MTPGRDYTGDMHLAHVLADQADSISLDRFRALDLQVDTKPDLTPVTDADHAVEEQLRITLARARTRDAVLGEEMGMTGHGPRRWAGVCAAVRHAGQQPHTGVLPGGAEAATGRGSAWLARSPSTPRPGDRRQ